MEFQGAKIGGNGKAAKMRQGQGPFYPYRPPVDAVHPGRERFGPG
jgi:hypothetical protein